MYGFTTEFEPFAVGFLSCESENLSKKAASGLLRAAEKMNITVDPDLGLVYAFQGMNCTLTFGGGITCNEDGLERLREDYPESAADIRYIIDNMKGYATGPKVFDAFSQTELDLLHSGSLWGGTWTGHAVPEFAAIASYGTDFIRKKVTAYSMKNTGSAEFYEAINTAMDAVDALGARAGEIAARMLEDETDSARRAHLEKLHDTFTHAPKSPCLDFAEACIVYTMLFTFDGVDSPGHFDQYMYPLWKKTDAGLRSNVVSVHLAKFPEYKEEMIDKELEARMQMAQDVTSMVLALRRKVNIKVRQPLQCIMIPVVDEEQRAHIEAVKALIMSEVNVKDIKFVDGAAGVLVKKVKCDFKKMGPKFGKQMKAVAAAVAEMSQDAIAELEKLDAEGRVAWALDNLPGEYVLSSSFGIQAAVSLHLVNQIHPDIPVILTDTGYLFPETYRFIDELTDKLKLNLKVYRATESAAWQEARYGKLWEQGVEGIEKYNDINKVEPMNRALKELNAQTWFAGLRREQSGSRANLPVLAIQRGVFKVLPIIDWDNRTIYQYLQKHGLKYHPLWDEGYLSVGDTHTTRKWEPGMSEEETRFFGLKRECGLHEG